MLVIVERGACSPEGVEERGEGLRGYQEPTNTWECVRVQVRSRARETHTLWSSLHYPGG